MHILWLQKLRKTFDSNYNK